MTEIRKLGDTEQLFYALDLDPNQYPKLPPTHNIVSMLYILAVRMDRVTALVEDLTKNSGLNDGR